MLKKALRLFLHCHFVSVVEQGINGTQPLFIANEGKTISLEDDFMRLTKKSTIDELQENKEVKKIFFI